MYPNFGYLSKLRKWDTHFDLLEKKKEEEFIGLKIKEINNELVIVNEELTDRKLTSILRYTTFWKELYKWVF